LPCLFLKEPPAAEWQPVDRIPALGVKMAETRENSIEEAAVLSKCLSVTPWRGEENVVGGR
jgi:hypothetical protein